jgi:hypothetical protein
MSKKIAIYGTYEVKVPVKKRVWKRRNDGVKQRYWKKTKQMKKTTKSGRYEFEGKGSDLFKAVQKAHEIMPEGFVNISAEEFLKHPEDFGTEGKWVEKDVES